MWIQMCLFIGIWLPSNDGARILGLFPYPAHSHSIVYNPIVTELANRGHKVTIITNFSIDKNNPNLTEIIIEPAYNAFADVLQHFQVKDLFSISELSVREKFDMLNLIGYKTNEYALKNVQVQELIRDKVQEFDLVLVEQFYQDVFLAFGYKYKAPIISICTFGFENYFTNIMGLINPWSQIPQGFSPYTDRMSFFERIINTYNSLYAEFNRRYIYFPQQDKLVRKYFSNILGPLPSVEVMEKNISVILHNSYVPMDISRPSVMGMVPIGGVHIKPLNALPSDLKTFLESADSGVIYFSLGTHLRSANMPENKINYFLKVFSKLKQKILWKWEDENIKNLPKNVKIKKWLPQSDILGHPNTKLFITHGGLLSNQEAVHRGVPMLGIPIFGDQHLNMIRATHNGFALTLHFPNITEESLTWALNELLNNPSYMDRMKQSSIIFRDRPEAPLDLAMFWIEYVLRYKGARHIRSAGVDLPWYKLYLLDVIAFCLIIVWCVVFFTKMLVKRIFKMAHNTNIKIIKKID